MIRDMGASGGVLSVTVGFLGVSAGVPGVSAGVPGPCRTMRTLWETVWMDIWIWITDRSFSAFWITRCVIQPDQYQKRGRQEDKAGSLVGGSSGHFCGRGSNEKRKRSKTSKIVLN